MSEVPGSQGVLGVEPWLTFTAEASLLLLRNWILKNDSCYLYNKIKGPLIDALDLWFDSAATVPAKLEWWGNTV